MEQIRRIMRPTDVPDQGLLCDLLWSDPDKETMGWGENDRGVSFTFGAEVVAKFLHKHDLDLICRAHQVCKVFLLKEKAEKKQQIFLLQNSKEWGPYCHLCQTYSVNRIVLLVIFNLFNCVGHPQRQPDIVLLLVFI